jgi:hypothetical protein
MDRRTRGKAFQVPARGTGAKPLKNGQERCPTCKRGVRPLANGLLHWHNDENGVRCKAPSVVQQRYYVYKGTGVDIYAESA